MAYTNDSKPSGSYSNESNSHTVVWDDASVAWDGIGGPFPIWSALVFPWQLTSLWNIPDSASTNAPWDGLPVYTDDAKPSGSYANDSKPS